MISSAHKGRLVYNVGRTVRIYLKVDQRRNFKIHDTFKAANLLFSYCSGKKWSFNSQLEKRKRTQSQASVGSSCLPTPLENLQCRWRTYWRFLLLLYTQDQRPRGLAVTLILASPSEGVVPGWVLGAPLFSCPSPSAVNRFRTSRPRTGDPPGSSNPQWSLAGGCPGVSASDWTLLPPTALLAQLQPASPPPGGGGLHSGLEDSQLMLQILQHQHTQITALAWKHCRLLGFKGLWFLNQSPTANPASLKKRRTLPAEMSTSCWVDFVDSLCWPFETAASFSPDVTTTSGEFQQTQNNAYYFLSL